MYFQVKLRWQTQKIRALIYTGFQKTKLHIYWHQVLCDIPLDSPLPRITRVSGLPHNPTRCTEVARMWELVGESTVIMKRSFSTHMHSRWLLARGFLDRLEIPSGRAEQNCSSTGRRLGQQTANQVSLFIGAEETHNWRWSREDPRVKRDQPLKFQILGP